MALRTLAGSIGVPTFVANNHGDNSLHPCFSFSCLHIIACWASVSASDRDISTVRPWPDSGVSSAPSSEKARVMRIVRDVRSMSSDCRANPLPSRMPVPVCVRFGTAWGRVCDSIGNRQPPHRNTTALSLSGRLSRRLRSIAPHGFSASRRIAEFLVQGVPYDTGMR